MLDKGSIKDFFYVPLMMRGFYVSYGLSLLAATLPAVLVFFYIRDFLGAEEKTWIFLGLYFISGIVALPFWLRGVKVFGKSQMWFAAMLLSVIAFCGAVFLSRGDVWQYGAICAAAGLSFGAEFALPPLVLKDLIVVANEVPRAAKRYALLAFLGKAALLLGCIMVLPALDFFGFKPGQGNERHVLAVLSFCYAALPCLIKGFALLTCWRWIKTYGGNLGKTSATLASGGHHAA